MKLSLFWFHTEYGCYETEQKNDEKSELQSQKSCAPIAAPAFCVFGKVTYSLCASNFSCDWWDFNVI